MQEHTLQQLEARIDTLQQQIEQLAAHILATEIVLQASGLKATGNLHSTFSKRTAPILDSMPATASVEFQEKVLDAVYLIHGLMPPRR